MSFWSTALKTVRSSLGETVTYKGTGALSEEIKAVFSDIAAMRELTNFNKIVDQEPQILVRLADLSQDIEQDHIFEIRSIEFYVALVEKDGEGGAAVTLREKID